MIYHYHNVKTADNLIQTCRYGITESETALNLQATSQFSIEMLSLNDAFPFL